MARVLVAGDALLDRDIAGTVERLSPDAPVPVVDQVADERRPGGAALAACLIAADGEHATLVTALGADAPGRALRRLLDSHGVEVIDLSLHGPTPEKIRIKAAGRPLVRLDRGGRGAPCGDASREALAALESADSVLVSDYGRGLASGAGLRAALIVAAERVPLVWDPHPRGAEPVPGAALVSPNDAEAAGFAARLGFRGDGQAAGVGAAATRGSLLREHWSAQAVCITRGAAGALLVTTGAAPMAVPADEAPGGDPCGAGDRFATTATRLLAAGEPIWECVCAAVAAGTEFVSAGGAAAALTRPGALADTPGSGLERLLARVRAAGGTVVATGGCFDLLHTGHVRTLEAARALGDCLVVLLNSDDSIRRLKGPDRPLVGEEDRAAVLEALGCVDAVVVFGEDTPARALDRVRPDVWVKGGDYAEADLPESRELERWGGRAMVLPYVDGRSTTRLIEEAQSRVT